MEVGTITESPEKSEVMCKESVRLFTCHIWPNWKFPVYDLRGTSRKYTIETKKISMRKDKQK